MHHSHIHIHAHTQQKVKEEGAKCNMHAHTPIIFMFGVLDSLL